MSIHPAPNVVIAARFRLNRLLGRGGMGSVWHATHLGLDVPCAVKFIEGDQARIPEMQARFEREAKAAAQLRSPHVVQILDHGVCDGTPYIAMELLEGEDLGKRLARIGRMPPHVLLPIVTQICRALNRAHAVGIVHRDLKPDNIFLVPDDDREITKVLDFGIAKATGSGAPGTSTRTGAMLGTPYYMSPEQAQGTKSVDSRSDLWSLAVIVFEALTGRRPFESDALGDLLVKIIVSPIPVPTHVARDLPSGTDAWWAKASQRDPSQRYQSAKELCDSLALAFGRSGGEVGEAAPMPAPAIPAAHSLPEPSGLTLTSQPPQGAATGAPIARTFAGRAPGLKGRMAFTAAIAGGFVVLTAGIVGVSYVVRGKGGAPVSVATGSVVAVVDAMAQPPASTPVIAIAAAPVESVAPTAAAPVVARPPMTKPVATSKPPLPFNPQPAVKPFAPAETKKKQVDLGI